MPKKVITIFLLILALFFITSSGIAQDIGQQGSLETIANTSGYKTDTSVASDTFLDTTVGGIIAMVLGIVGALFLGLTIYSGFQWMTAGGNEDKVTTARKRIINSAAGIGLIILAYVISNAVFIFFYSTTEREITVPQTLGGEYNCHHTQPPCDNPSSPCPECPGTMMCNVNNICVCTSSNQCPGNLVCNNGQCVVECISDNDCPENYHCTMSGECVLGETPGSECETNVDCSTIWGDVKPFCISFLGTWYFCVECETDAHCQDESRSIYDPEKPHCYSTATTNFCAKCGTDDHCEPDEECVAGSCVPE